MSCHSKTNVQKIVLGGVVARNEKILILQCHKDEDVYPNMWELPSGKREPLEPSEDSLIREVKEETGLEEIDKYDFTNATKNVIGKAFEVITNLESGG